MFTVTLFKIAKTWKQCKYPLPDEWTKKIGIHAHKWTKKTGIYIHMYTRKLVCV